MDKITPAQKRLIQERILQLDPKNELVTLKPNVTFSGGTITYNAESGLTLHEHISKLTDEEFVPSK
jgi:hypothetical protein